MENQSHPEGSIRQSKVKLQETRVSDIHRQTNERIYDRNIPSQMLQPYLDVRPVMTKYAYFPIVEPRKQINVPLQQIPTYNVSNVFNPGNTRSPWSGFACNINKESELRNQIYALQKCSQSVYVPNSTSDLYTYNFQTPYTPNQHELLFKDETETFNNFNPNPSPMLCGSGIFFNSTRCQVKDITNQTY
jgi:hypothetical protein